MLDFGVGSSFFSSIASLVVKAAAGGEIDRIASDAVDCAGEDGVGVVDGTGTGGAGVGGVLSSNDNCRTFNSSFGVFGSSGFKTSGVAMQGDSVNFGAAETAFALVATEEQEWIRSSVHRLAGVGETAAGVCPCTLTVPGGQNT